MKIEIDQKVLDATKACDKDFICLNGSPACFCPVKLCVDGQIHFVEYVEDRRCRYRMQFGSGYFCACPTRKEIYNRYQI